MTKQKRRNSKKCLFNDRAFPYPHCDNPKPNWVFCDGVCKYFKEVLK